MEKLEAIEVDHDFENMCVDVEFSDGSTKSFHAKPVKREGAIELIVIHVKKRLKDGIEAEEIKELARLMDFDEKHDYEITDDLINVTGDFGYFVAYPNNKLSINKPRG